MPSISRIVAQVKPRWPFAPGGGRARCTCAPSRAGAAARPAARRTSRRGCGRAPRRRRARAGVVSPRSASPLLRATEYHAARPRARAQRTDVSYSSHSCFSTSGGRSRKRRPMPRWWPREAGPDPERDHLHGRGDDALRIVDLDVQRELGLDRERVLGLHEHAAARDVGHQAANELAVRGEGHVDRVGTRTESRVLARSPRGGPARNGSRGTGAASASAPRQRATGPIRGAGGPAARTRGSASRCPPMPPERNRLVGTRT
jgi:hypothetical protein